MAAGAVAGDRPVQSVEGEAGLGSVVERARVEGPQIRIDAGVLDVARDAAARRITVHPAPRANPLRDRLVALQAAGGCDLPSRLVTLLTVGRALQGSVRPRERTW